MAFWRRGGRAAAAGQGGQASAQESGEVARHLEEFVRSRVGVEAYVEPPTTVLPRTVMLVATDGEWTRRRLPDPQTLQRLVDALGLPVYDARITGYPQRMRDWNSQQRNPGS